MLLRRRALSALPLLALACSPAATPPAASQPPAPTTPTPLASATPPPPPAGPPVAPVRNVTDVYFGTHVVDPYRWMETPSPELDTWMKGQADYARAALDALPGRADLFARIQKLDDDTRGVWDVETVGGAYFYLATDPGQQTRKLLVRSGLAGKERTLVDPDSMATGDKHMSIDWFSPSLDGKLVAFGVSPSGSEDSVLHVIDVATGKLLPDTIDRAQAASLSWIDGHSFFWTRLQKLGPNAEPTDRYKRMKTYVHVLGTNGDDDAAVAGVGVNPSAAIGEDDFVGVYAPPGASMAILAKVHGVKREVGIFTAPLSTFGKGKVPTWKMVADEPDEITSFAVHGDDLFLLSHHGASRFQVLRTSASHPDLAHAKTIVPAGELVVDSISAAKDGLYVKLLDGGMSRLRRLPYGGGPAVEIPLPVDGTADSLFTVPSQPGVVFKFLSWTVSPRWYAYDATRKALVDTAILPASPADFSAITSSEVKAKSADGTMVPLSVVHRRGLASDGSHPTWLDGYGAYGIVDDPWFRATQLAWLERGGVYAVCHARGGGEYGEDWHRAGMIGTKQHTIDDFIGCAQYLIDQKLTSPAHLAGEGRSAGGVTIGGALTQRPDLFAAAFIGVGDCDALRSETMPSGPANIPEFGTVKTEDGFRALYAMDAFQHVKDGTAYPAVLLTTGVSDPRVAPWQAAKMAARLQAATSSGKPILLRVDYDAGHGMGSTKSQADAELADAYAFLFAHLGGLPALP